MSIINLSGDDVSLEHARPLAKLLNASYTNRTGANICVEVICLLFIDQRSERSGIEFCTATGAAQGGGGQGGY